VGRLEKAMSSNSNMYGSRESYSGIVPAKPPNNTRSLVAEGVEERPLTKEKHGRA
jgi:hypothetical protein